MADLPGATAIPEDGQVPLDVSPVTAGQGDQSGLVSGDGTAVHMTAVVGSSANSERAPPPLSTPTGQPFSVPSSSTTPYRPAYGDAKATPAQSTIPAGVPPDVFTPGPSAGSWVYTPYSAPAPNTGSQAASTWAGQLVYPAQEFGPGTPQHQTSGAGTSKEHARGSRYRRRHHRRRRGSSTSSSLSSTGTDSSEERYETPTRRHLVEFSFPSHQVGDATLNKVTDWCNYRLENHDQTYTRKMAKKMASLNQRMQPSFGGHPKFSGKKPSLIFAFQRRFVKACNDNDILEGKALYLMVKFMAGEAEQRFAQVLPDSACHVLGRTVGSYPEAANCDAYAKSKIGGRLRTAPRRLFPASEPLTDVSVDLLGPLPETAAGSRYLVLMVNVARAPTTGDRPDLTTTLRGPQSTAIPCDHRAAGRYFVWERLVDHTQEEDGNLWLLVR